MSYQKLLWEAKYTYGYQTPGEGIRPWVESLLKDFYEAGRKAGKAQERRNHVRRVRIKELRDAGFTNVR